jgi:hypothetical protein
MNYWDLLVLPFAVVPVPDTVLYSVWKPLFAIPKIQASSSSLSRVYCASLSTLLKETPRSIDFESRRIFAKKASALDFRINITVTAGFTS